MAIVEFGAGGRGLLTDSRWQPARDRPNHDPAAARRPRCDPFRRVCSRDRFGDASIAPIRGASVAGAKGRAAVTPSQLASAPSTGQDWDVHGFVAPTDHGWYQFLRARPEITEVNFWRPGGGLFRALPPGAPFFFKLKRPHDAIGGFGLFARAERLPVWRAWDVFGQANGTRDEHELLLRLDRLGGRDNLGLGHGRMIGCVAITEPVFFAPDEPGRPTGRATSSPGEARICRAAMGSGCGRSAWSGPQQEPTSRWTGRGRPSTRNALASPC